MTTRVYTFGGMLAEVQADTDRTSASEVLAMRRAIESAVQHYQRKRFWFNESRSTTFNTVAGTDTYTFNTLTTTGTIAAEFDRIDGVWITISSTDIRELDPVDYADWESWFDSDTTQGQPSDYGYINKAIRIHKIPDAVYSMRIAGHIIVPFPAADATADNMWFTEGFDLIMARAKAWLYANRWEDPNNASLMVQVEKSELDALIDATTDKFRTGFIQATDF